MSFDLKRILIGGFFFLLWVSPGAAEEHSRFKDPCNDPSPPLLQSHEPNTVGVTKDSNDVFYLDLKMSLKYPIFHKGIYCGRKAGRWGLPFFYAAGTVRFAQHSNTDRHSSPVIGKRYNPMFFGRYWIYGEDSTERVAYLDLGYAHESNGQSVDDEAEFLALQASNPDRPEIANDFISRGWDYINVDFKTYFPIGADTLFVYGDFKYFPNRSPPQGVNEEYSEWEGEGPDQPKRRNVDGITAIVKFTTEQTWLCGEFFRGCKLAAIYTTGYDEPFKYNTARFEFTGKFGNLPVMVWTSGGYMNDLADYYKRVRSYGFALELKTFG
ncbi:MAG TPA: hypothetical protein VIU33_03160 [Nitrospiria bacterium]